MIGNLNAGTSATNGSYGPFDTSALPDWLEDFLRTTAPDEESDDPPREPFVNWRAKDRELRSVMDSRQQNWTAHKRWRPILKRMV